MKRVGCLLAFLLLPILIVLALFSAFGGQSSGGDSAAVRGVRYVKHWSGDSAYSHHFLAQRYGITIEQIEGFIRSQGFEPVGRASGQAFLEAQASSGIDVRVLVAFAQLESAYGTAGVAAQFPEANIWGYGAFDNDPNNGRNWGPERAFRDFRTNQIERLGNSSLQIMDERAEQFASGTLPSGKGVYYTDTSGTGKARAQVMEAFDKWIDEHGGTPDPPSGYGSVSPANGDYAHLFDEPYTITQPYGYTAFGAGVYTRTGGRHTGLDLVPVAGSVGRDVPVYAMTDGHVKTVSNDATGFGYFVTIEPDFGGYLIYAHLKYPSDLRVGEPIRKGDKIGVLGSTGLSTGDHVHLQYSPTSEFSNDQDPSFLLLPSGVAQEGQVFTP